MPERRVGPHSPHVGREPDEGMRIEDLLAPADLTADTTDRVLEARVAEIAHRKMVELNREHPGEDVIECGPVFLAPREIVLAAVLQDQDLTERVGSARLFETAARMLPPSRSRPAKAIRARRPHMRGRGRARRPGCARKVASRAAGGGSSGDSDEGEPARGRRRNFDVGASA